MDELPVTATAAVDATRTDDEVIMLVVLVVVVLNEVDNTCDKPDDIEVAW